MKINSVRISDSIVFDNSFIYLQSMCSIPYSKFKLLETQIESLSKTNCSLVRLSIRNENDISIAKILKNRFENEDFVFVADTHFNPQIAILSIRNGFKKVRINPGNMDFNQMTEISKVAKDNNATIRIGLNGGSISEKLGSKYSIDDIINLFEKYLEPFVSQDFYNIVLSAKFTDYNYAIELNQKLAEKFNFPIHLGVTEAGTIVRSTILHTLFLNDMLKKGIGSTTRISITADSLKEIEVGNEILKSIGAYKGINIISCPTCGRTWGDLIQYVEKLSLKVKELEYKILCRQNMPDNPINCAIMGCEVNGPGEAKDADFGVSLTKEGAILFSNGKIIGKIKKDEIVNSLLSLISEKIKKNHKKN